MLVQYPTTFPTEAAQSLFAIVKSKDIAGQKIAFGLAVWNIQGYLQAKILADNTISFGAQPTAVIHNIEDAIATVHELEPHPGAFGSWYTDASLMLLKPLVKWALTEVLKQL